jgi:hypothetical protein
MWMATTRIGRMKTVDQPGEIHHGSFPGPHPQMGPATNSLRWFTPMVSIPCRSFGVHALNRLTSGTCNSWTNICIPPVMTASKLCSPLRAWTTIVTNIWNASQAIISTTTSFEDGHARSIQMPPRIGTKNCVGSGGNGEISSTGNGFGSFTI